MSDCAKWPFNFPDIEVLVPWIVTVFEGLKILHIEKFLNCSLDNLNREEDFRVQQISHMENLRAPRTFQVIRIYAQFEKVMDPRIFGIGQKIQGP